MTNLTGYSMVRTYRRCPKQYDYAYLQNLQRKKPVVPLLRGTILHELLDARATGRNETRILKQYAEQYRMLFIEEREEYGEDFIGSLHKIYDGYQKTYANDGWTYEGSEETIFSNLTPTLRVRCTIDKRVRTPDGRRWIVDHKCVKEIPDESMRFNDYQILLYVEIWNRENPKEQVDGIIWDYLRTKAPRVPEPLKKGGLSQAQNIDTDYDTYLTELRRNKLDIGPYRQFLMDLKRRTVGKFYQRIPLPTHSRAMTEQVVKDFHDTSVIMHGIQRYPRHMDRSCSWQCQFYRLCSAELRGLDAKFIEKTEYEQRPQDEETVDPE